MYYKDTWILWEYYSLFRNTGQNAGNYWSPCCVFAGSMSLMEPAAFCGQVPGPGTSA